MDKAQQKTASKLGRMISAARTRLEFSNSEPIEDVLVRVISSEVACALQCSRRKIMKVSKITNLEIRPAKFTRWTPSTNNLPFTKSPLPFRPTKIDRQIEGHISALFPGKGSALAFGGRIKVRVKNDVCVVLKDDLAVVIRL